MSALIPTAPRQFVDVLVLRNMPTKGGRSLIGYPLEATKRGNGLVTVFMRTLAGKMQVQPGARVRAAKGDGLRMNLAEIYVPTDTSAAA